jgi:NADH:ubiquinone oxidoreductase subunit 5 (subunit L)/multisubunit Na+/H+ antiporter MnhA subunit
MLGSTLTLLSFLKLTFSTYMGEAKPQHAAVREAHWTMTLPMLVIAAGCVLFGVYNPLPIKLFIQPLIAGLPGAEGAAEPLNLAAHAWAVTPVTIMAMGFLILALVIFFAGKARTKQAVTAVDFIHHAPILRSFYDWSEKRYFDIYHQGVRFLTWLAGIVFRYVERVVDWLWEGFARLAVMVGQQMRKAHTGLLAMYVSWLVAGLFFLLLIVGGIFR